MTTNHCSVLSAAILAVVLIVPVAGAESTASIDAGIGYSDNITRTSGDKVDETLATVGLNVDAQRAEGRLTGLFRTDLQYISYLNNTYKDDVYGRVDLAGDYAFVPDFFSWRLEDSWGQIRSDPFAVQNPANLENTNYFSTGPDFTFHLGPRTRLQLTGRWSDTTYQTSPRDYSRLGGGLALSRDVSERTSIGLHGYASHVEFDDSAFGTNYDAQEYFGRYTTQGAKTHLELDAGYTEVRRDGESSGNPLFRLTVTREVSARSTLNLTAGTQFTDAGQTFQGIGENVGGPGYGGPGDVIGVGDAYESRHFGLRWTTRGQRGQFGLGANYRQELYETQTALDRKITDVYADYSRGLSEALRLRVAAHYEMDKYDSGAPDDKRLRLDAGLAWDLSRRIFVSADYEFYKGDSQSSSLNYDENRAWLRVGYRAR
jgi:hypothetical protein